MTSNNPVDQLAQQVPGLDLWQPRDWPHRRGDTLALDILSFPLTESSPGRRSHPCDQCGQDCLCIHDNVLCWNCKGAFCLFHFVKDPAVLMSMGQDRVVKNGWGDCPNCKERLRSMALIDVFRKCIDQQSGGKFGQKYTLLEEAEWALGEAKTFSQRLYNEKKLAILRCTHAINAVNYLVSSSNGGQLILRAQDILLGAHALRGHVEGNPALFDSILERFPTASVVVSTKAPKNYDRETFKACFYSLPAEFMAPATGELICIDTRDCTLDQALQHGCLHEQLKYVGQPEAAENYLNSSKKLIPSCSGSDPVFESLKGMMKGMQGFIRYTSDVPQPCAFGNYPLAIIQTFQFLWSFPTARAASEYYRLKDLGDNCPGLEFKSDDQLAEALLEKIGGNAKRISVKVTQPSAAYPTYVKAFTVVAVIDSMVTKIFAMVALSGSTTIKDIVLTLVAKGLSRIHKVSTSKPGDGDRSTSGHIRDPTSCAFCGKNGSDLLKCSACKVVYYCDHTCQRTHWKMKGPFGHKNACVSTTPEKTFVLQVGDKAILVGLQSAKHLNGMEAIVLSGSKPNGRRAVVLIDDLSTQELTDFIHHALEFSAIDDDRKKSIKEGNLERSTTQILPCIRDISEL